MLTIGSAQCHLTNYLPLLAAIIAIVGAMVVEMARQTLSARRLAKATRTHLRAELRLLGKNLKEVIDVLDRPLKPAATVDVMLVNEFPAHDVGLVNFGHLSTHEIEAITRAYAHMRSFNIRMRYTCRSQINIGASTDFVPVGENERYTVIHLCGGAALSIEAAVEAIEKRSQVRWLGRGDNT